MKPSLTNALLEMLFYGSIVFVCAVTALSERGLLRTPLLHPATRQHVEEPPTCKEAQDNVSEMLKNNIRGAVADRALKEQNDICNLHRYVPIDN